MSDYPSLAVRRLSVPVEPGPRRAARTVRCLSALARACHPLPTVAVTAFVTAVAAAAGRGVAGSAAVGAAVLAGQASIGWCNDALDARRDAAAGRTDKPAASGELSPRAIGVASGLSLAACVPLSLLSGWPAGAAHLVGVLAGGWAYDVALKRTPLSPLPYAVGLGSLPAFVTLGLPGHPWPAWWAVTGAALLGVGAHLLNVLPDIADDRAGGVRGLPQRLGPRWVRRLAPPVLLTAVAVVACGPSGGAGPLGWATLAAAAPVAAAGAAWPADERSNTPFLAAVAVAGLTVFLLVARGGRLT
ncbi:UbiA family prenyltransferase [Yinghuangia seranimata]|uniref:UbiA family prenyltransferase n=1 Tax=Yinghuangia seranimata TaxID=408067 RepID=UPI00248BF2E0|nr:UbiA family prenyltransferase [Yinghuangia seranimata]MDI2124691.1 UbiA family prenyltransferase [Yinghuangia seranimata]